MIFSSSSHRRGGFEVVLLFAIIGPLACGGCRAHSRQPAAPTSHRTTPPAGTRIELSSPESFATITSRAGRSRALFVEASKVLLHPRCANCHPNGDSPSQGEELRLHDPPVARGPHDHGVVGMQCTSCHQDHNLELARVPGAPKWHLAARSMAWVGNTRGAICEQLKDPARNGGKTLAEIVEHSAHDPLVAWGWAPGAGRAPAPGSQSEFGALMAEWVKTGAECPVEELQQ